MPSSLVLPGLHDAAAVEVRELTHLGTRVWTDVGRRTTVVRLIPDLSRDVLATPEGPALIARTVRAVTTSLDRAQAVVGVRLPIAATDIRIDPAWHGWRARRRPAEDRLADAIAEGAVGWREDPLVAAFLSAAATDTRIADAASAAFVSERTLRRRVLAVLGVGPVQARRVLRLHRFHHSLRRLPVSEAASSAGYADQSHAARDLRSLVGMPLRAFAALHVSE